jgi:Holliday junction resolvase
MMIWRYNINPNSPQGYDYGWDLKRPVTLLKSSDRTWPMLNNFKQVNVGDEIAVYFKNVGGGIPDGIRVLGDVVAVDRTAKTFTWHPDKKRTLVALGTPMLADEQERFFGRAWGAAMKRLPLHREAEWKRRFGGKAVLVEGVPVVSVKKKPKGSSGWTNPEVSKAYGQKGERYVLKCLKGEFPKSKGYNVVHIAATNPTGDHDIEVRKGKSKVLLVEVKTRADEAGMAPVLISENELRCRREWKGRHRITVVYLSRKGHVVRCLNIDENDAFTLSPRQYWLTPGTP